MVVAGRVKEDGGGKQGKRRINIGADASKSYKRTHLPRGMGIIDLGMDAR